VIGLFGGLVESNRELLDATQDSVLGVVSTPPSGARRTRRRPCGRQRRTGGYRPVDLCHVRMVWSPALCPMSSLIALRLSTST
jgi:hypothetical protein